MPEFHTIDIIMIISAYLAGSVSSAIIFARIMGLPDPRQQGSNNPGATNMLRIGGKKAAILTLAGDMIKGVIPVVIARYVGVQPELLIIVGFAAFIGHLYPIFFSFQGGKGVATAIGILLATEWMIALFTIAVWLSMSLLTKTSSLSALTAFFLTPIFVGLMGYSQMTVMVLSILTLILIWRHRSNIRKLIDGTE
ncbi:Acyl-phosphate:glycerol-3-phosphate O-acyltransferase PlsY (EC 2.3.1.n3) [hydrothermal vent metagenome]|uniref:Acyl-phosphate:glycerol-3-phosphate O-acyltransferase PlsY n=1 Tax=hydrothermal vent metagenome TaxID=652676 RepID=A0A3B0Y433_9ZZZZ